MTYNGPLESRAALALAELRRRTLLDTAEPGHFERTPRSFLADRDELDRVEPAAEARAGARFKRDLVIRLVGVGTLTHEQGRAAQEIQMIHERIGTGPPARADDPGARGPRGWFGVTEWVVRLHAQHYRPWVRYLAGRAAEAPAPEAQPLGLAAPPAREGRCAAALAVALEVLVDGRSLRECDAARRWRNGTAAKVLAYALAVYADIAGWERGGDAVAAFEAWWGRRGGRRR